MRFKNNQIEEDDLIEIFYIKEFIENTKRELIDRCYKNELNFKKAKEIILNNLDNANIKEINSTPFKEVLSKER